jgi:uncharacterized protein involved in type VI secretion and phage assembly
MRVLECFVSAGAARLEMRAPELRAFGACHLAEVVSVSDPDSRSRVQVRLLSYDGVQDQDAAVWARVAVPFAGSDYGAFFLPDVGEEVVVSLINGDPRFPIVIGSLWNGNAQAPEQLAGSAVDRWTIVGKAGTRIAIIEETSGQETIMIETPNGVSAELTDSGGGKFECTNGQSTITIDSQGVTIDCTATVKVTASRVEVSSGMVQVDAGMSKFSGVVQCDTLIATTVVGSTYTPGAGNVW